MITELGVGEALVSLLDEKGRPSVVERAFIVPPAARSGRSAPDERSADPALARRWFEVREDGRPRVGLREAQERAPKTSPSCSRSRPNKPAAPARQHAEHPRRRDQERGARHRLGARPPDHARSPRLDPRQRPAPLTAGTPYLSGTAYRGLGHRFRPRRRAGVLVPPDPDQALVRRAPGQPGHAAVPAHDAVAAVLPRDRLVAAQPAAAPDAARLAGDRRPRLPRLLRGELPRLRRPAVGRRRRRPADPLPLPDAGGAALVPLPAQAADAARDRGAGDQLLRHRAGGVEPDCTPKAACSRSARRWCSPPRSATRCISSSAARW